MENDWKFLPDVPKSFKQTKSNSVKISTNYKKFYFDVEQNNIDLILKRSSEPINVSLKAEKLSSKISYQIYPDLIIYAGNHSQDAIDQKFNCYSFNDLVVGSCQNADLNITSSNPKYNGLGDNLVLITGEITSKALGFKKTLNHRLINAIDLSYQQVDHSFNWLSPIEDISSPILLGLNIGNSTLGEEIEKVLANLPQRDGWQTNILNFNAQNQYKLGSNFSIEPSIYLKFLDFKNYNNNSSIPRINIKFRLSISYMYKKAKFTLFGDYYHKNLLGFENIAFNQRTESYFDRPYGDLGLSITLAF
tara:strand:- start:658 stop:1572 length:915 start_codon:yes stop_codon:yes gene_type:complete